MKNGMIALGLLVVVGLGFYLWQFPAKETVTSFDPGALRKVCFGGDIDPSFGIYVADVVEGPQFSKKMKSPDGQEFFTEIDPSISNTDFTYIMPSEDASGAPILVMQFSAKGKEKVSSVTSQNIKKRLPIVFQEQVLMAPIVLEPINEGRLVMEFSFETAESDKSLFEQICNKVSEMSLTDLEKI